MNINKVVRTILKENDEKIYTCPINIYIGVELKELTVHYKIKTGQTKGKGGRYSFAVEDVKNTISAIIVNITENDKQIFLNDLSKETITQMRNIFKRGFVVRHMFHGDQPYNNYSFKGVSIDPTYKSKESTSKDTLETRSKVMVGKKISMNLYTTENKEFKVLIKDIEIGINNRIELYLEVLDDTVVLESSSLDSYCKLIAGHISKTFQKYLQITKMPIVKELKVRVAFL